MDMSGDDLVRRAQEITAAAERLLPHLLELSGLALTRELGRHPELQPGLALLLVDRADRAVDSDPLRAHDFTAAVIAQAGSLSHLHALADHLIGRAWTAHADALRALGRYGQAHDAIAAALELFARSFSPSWFSAMANVVAARILHEEQLRDEALRRIRDAAAVLLRYGDVDRYVRVRAIEASMLWDAGDRKAAAGVWSGAALDALECGNLVAAALLQERTGIFLLRHGEVDDAARSFDVALTLFESAGRAREALRCRWHRAEVAAARGEFDEAVGEFYPVQALMLGAGDVIPAAVVSAEILELLLVAGRDDEILPLADLIVETFSDAGLTLNALRAWTFVRQRARAGRLTVEDITAVRLYFERLPLRPNALFEPPEPGR